MQPAPLLPMEMGGLGGSEGHRVLEGLGSLVGLEGLAGIGGLELLAGPEGLRSREPGRMDGLESFGTWRAFGPVRS